MPDDNSKILQNQLNHLYTGSTIVQPARRKLKSPFKSLDLKRLFGSKYSTRCRLLSAPVAFGAKSPLEIQF